MAAKKMRDKDNRLNRLKERLFEKSKVAFEKSRVIFEKVLKWLDD